MTGKKYCLRFFFYSFKNVNNRQIRKTPRLATVSNSPGAADAEARTVKSDPKNFYVPHFVPIQRKNAEPKIVASLDAPC